MSKNTPTMLQLKIQLRNVTKPPVWRRLQIPPDITFLEQDCGGPWGYQAMKDSGGADDPKYFDLEETDADVRHYRSMMQSGEDMWDRKYDSPGDPEEADEYENDDWDDDDEEDAEDVSRGPDLR